MTPDVDRKERIAYQDVSLYPRNTITAVKTSTTGAGGFLKDLISFRLLGLSWPTAALAASTSGYTPPSSCSTSSFRFSMCCWSALHYFWSDSTSVLRAAFYSIDTWIFYMLALASFCATLSFFFFSTASFESVSTASAAWASFSRPEIKCLV